MSIERLRNLVEEIGTIQCHLYSLLPTWRVISLDDDGGSKREHETTVEDADILVIALTALGVEEFIALRKNCVNYRFTALERDLLATLVTVAELENQTFIELETMTEADDLESALDVARPVLRELGISEQDLTGRDIYGRHNRPAQTVSPGRGPRTALVSPSSTGGFSHQKRTALVSNSATPGLSRAVLGQWRS